MTSSLLGLNSLALVVVNFTLVLTYFILLLIIIYLRTIIV